MMRRSWPMAVLCALILLIFAYSFWIGAQKRPAEGGPAAISD
jgi:hypothetical protein